ncbi:septum formation initiator family protein [uncultured Algimonas sp.]|uniref:FtsB family cell division protein n=1 Tax=uncultured Algimonas sp. TaxID=1547920 RepID=UPI002620141A|nr:septum formation initiator family protein [uncultured Algimonas sp.]
MRRLDLKLPALKRRAPAAALTVIYLYLGYHALSGSQGLVRWLEQSDRAERLELRLSALEARRDALQAEVDLLSADGLDLDSLDMEARRLLHVARPDELTIWVDP